MKWCLIALCALAIQATSGFAAPDLDPGHASELMQCRAIGLTVCPQPFDVNLPPAEKMLSWDQHTRIVGFRNTYRLYQGDVFHARGGGAYPLPAASFPMPGVQYEMDGRSLSLDDYLAHQSATALLVLKDGHVVYEYYGSGNTDQTLWTSRSVAKSVVSVLVGIAIKEGLIRSVDDPIIHYLPDLKGTAWEHVSLRNLLQHTSGVAWNENYADPNSDFARLTRCEASPAPYPCVLHLVSSLERRPGVKPGDVWSYNTGGAWLVGRVLERATKMTIAGFLETRLWSRFAMQNEGVWEALLKNQVDMGGHGFNATLRDWGRFAQFVVQGGKLASGEELLPAGWLEQSMTWTKAKGSVTPASPNGQFGYQWWFAGVDPAHLGDGSVMATARESLWAEGIYGQTIAIDPAAKLVLVQWSSWQQAEGPDSLYTEQALFFNALKQALDRRH